MWKDMLMRVNAGMRELGAAAAVALTDTELLARGMELAALQGEDFVQACV